MFEIQVFRGSTLVARLFRKKEKVERTINVWTDEIKLGVPLRFETQEVES